MEEKKKKPESNFSKNTKAIIILVFAIFLFLTVVYNRPHTSKKVIFMLKCRATLHNLALTYYIYENENKIWADKREWCDLLNPYLRSDDVNVYQCPADKIGPCSYAMNENILVDVNELPGDLVLLFESDPGWNQVGGADDVVTDRHGENNPGANIAFADGHVEFVSPEDIPNLRWTVD